MLKAHPETNFADETTSNKASLKSGDNVVEIDGLVKKYGRKTVVDQLSFVVPRGSVYGLIGPNGAGKSTTLKSLMRILRTSGGSMKILGHDVTDDFQVIKNRVGYVPETHQIYRWMKVGRVIEFTRSFYPTWNDGFCDQMLELMELDPDKKVKHLSKGMLAKLALLLAVCHEPDLLILDEPLSGLDPIVRDEFIDGVLKTICEQETTVIFSSHTIGDVQRLADFVGILYDGKLLVDKSIEQMLGEARQLKIVVEKESQEQLGGIPDGLIHQSRNGKQFQLTVPAFESSMLHGLESQNRLEDISVERVNLEDLFKAYIHGAKSKKIANLRGVKHA